MGRGKIILFAIPYSLFALLQGAELFLDVGERQAKAFGAVTVRAVKGK